MFYNIGLCIFSIRFLRQMVDYFPVIGGWKIDNVYFNFNFRKKNQYDNEVV